MHSRDVRAGVLRGKLRSEFGSLLLTVVNQGVESLSVGEISLGAGFPSFAPLLGQFQAFFVLDLSGLIWLSCGFSFGMLPGQVSDFPHS